MKLIHLNQGLGDREIHAIFWTLIHSLWIGLIVAVLAALLIACTRRAKTKLRYRLFCSLLVVFTLIMIGVAMYEMVEKDSGPTTGNLPSIFSAEQSLNGNTVIAYSSSSLIQTVVAFLNQNSLWIFALWFIFFMFKSMKLIVGIFYIQRIRRYSIKELNEKWVSKVQTFTSRMGIKKQVSVIQSALVKVPVTIGYFKPIIVLPIGLIFQLPVEQVETILWHELAHIYRRDYLVNILQKMVEAIFFFNPAVLWLSALIREEREACCDDIVLDNVQQKTSYLAALVAFHNGKNSLGGLAMGLNLRPNQLMNRLRRMVYQENKRLSLVELFILAIGLLMLSAFTYIPQVKPGIKSGVVYIKKAFSETLASAGQEVGPLPKSTAKQLKSTTILMPNKPDLGLDTLLKFKSIRFKNSNEDKANREVNVIDGQDNRYHVIVASGLITAVEFNEKTVPANEFKNYENLLAQIDDVILRKLKNPSSQYIKDSQMDKKVSGWQKKALPIDKKFFSDSAKAPVGQQLNAKELFFLKPANVGAQAAKKKIAPVDASNDKARVLGVIALLVEHQVVSNSAAVSWFALTDEQLVVNGQKQNSQLHQQFKEKFGVRANYGLFFGPTKVHGVGIIFEKSDL